MTTLTDVRDRMTDGGRGRYRTQPSAIIGIAVHHSVSGGQFFTAATLTADDEINHLRMIDAYHVSKDWGAFGYHAAAFPSGNAYLCGDWGGARAHVASRNNVLLGVVLIGDFTTTGPPMAQLAAARDLCALADAAFARPLPIRGHREWALPDYPTACPGDTWQAWLPQLEPRQEEHPLTDEDKAWVLQHSGGLKLLQGSAPAIYIADHRGKRPFPGGPPQFSAVGFHWDDVDRVPDSVLAAIPNMGGAA